MDKSNQEYEWGIRSQRDETNMIRILRATLTSTSNCVDIGAHKGVFLNYFLQLSPEGRHFAFEPLPGLVSALKENFPTVSIFPCALGDRKGRVTFCHVLNLPGWSGLKMQPYPVESDVEEIEVDIMTLDEALPSDVRINFIKIDVEGAELEVLKGASAVIKKHKPFILFEHARIHNAEYVTTPEMLYDLLVTECGLAIYCLDGKGPLNKDELVNIYYTSYSSNYDRHAQTSTLR